VLSARPWTSHEDIVLQRLAAAGKYAAAIAAEMNRSESTIRNRAALLNLTLAKGQRGPKAKAKGAMTGLHKFVEKGQHGEETGRAAYVFQSSSLPQPAEGTLWHPVRSFNAAEELLYDPSLGAVFKMAIQKGCAVVTPKAKGPSE
jgi:hypothetical protein